MDDRKRHRIEYWTAWSGPAFIVTYLYFFLILGHNIPPPSSSLSGAALVATYYVPYRHDILLGMVMSAVAGMLYLPWSILLSVQMWRQEKSPILNLMQITGGVLTTWLLMFCPVLWAWCAKFAGTPGLDPETIKAVHTFTWYWEDCTYWITGIQLVGCGLFAILDKKSEPIFPAWAGWIAIAVAAIFVPLSAMPFVDSGPLAVDGSWSFFIVFGTWGLWFAVYSYYMFKDVARWRISAVSNVTGGVRA